MIAFTKNILKGVLRKYNLLPKTKIITVGKFQIVADMDCQLDGYLASFKNYSRNFAQLASVVVNAQSDDLIVDIGANIGDTVALLRSEKIPNPILCIEGNLLYLNLLQENIKQFDSVEIVNVFLGKDNTGYGGELITHDGTAKIIKSDSSFVETISLNSLFKDKERPKVKILKTDTDGFDIIILEGSSEIIRRDLPIIFFEYDTALNISNLPCLAYLTSLKDYGYSKVMYFDNFGNFIISASLSDEKTLYQVDRYISNGAFAYYDVAVFNEKDNAVFEETLTFFENL